MCNYKFISYLGGISLFLAVLGYVLFDGWLGVKSILLGQGAWLLPDLCFFSLRRRITTLYNTKKMVIAFLGVEFTKLFLSAGLIILILLTCTVHSVGFFSGYIVSVGSMLLLLKTMCSKRKT